MSERSSIDKRSLKCGLLRADVSKVKKELAGLSVALERAGAGQPHPEIRKVNINDLNSTLLYHRFEPDNTIDYDYVWFLFERIAARGSTEWLAWLDGDFKHSKFESRYLRAYWRIDDQWLLTLQLGLSRLFSDMDKASGNEALNFRVEVGFSGCRWIKPTLEIRRKRQQRSRLIAELLCPAFRKEPPSLIFNADSGLPGKLVRADISIEEASNLFRDCEANVSNLLVTPDIVSFAFDSYALAQRLQNSEILESRVWSQMRLGGKLKKGGDIYQNLGDDSTVRPYVLLNVRSNTKTWPDFNFQMTLVHAREESFIECQASDSIWFDWISNYFQAPIDVWEGPIEARFGWYGDASLGKLVRHPTDPTRVLGSGTSSTAPITMAYAVFPIGVNFDGNTFELNENRYANPHAIFNTQAEAEKYAQEHLASLLQDCELPDLTSRNPEFDLSKLPCFKEICELVEIEEPSKWREEFEQLYFATLPDEDMNRLIELIGIKTYRIIRLDLNDKEYKRIEKAIASENFSDKVSSWLAKRAGLEEFDGWD